MVVRAAFKGGGVGDFFFAHFRLRKFPTGGVKG